MLRGSESKLNAQQYLYAFEKALSNEINSMRAFWSTHLGRARYYIEPQSPSCSHFIFNASTSSLVLVFKVEYDETHHEMSVRLETRNTSIVSMRPVPVFFSHSEIIKSRYAGFLSTHVEKYIRNTVWHWYIDKVPRLTPWWKKPLRLFPWFKISNLK